MKDFGKIRWKWESRVIGSNDWFYQATHIPVQRRINSHGPVKDCRILLLNTSREQQQQNLSHSTNVLHNSFTSTCRHIPNKKAAILECWKTLQIYPSKMKNEAKQKTLHSLGHPCTSLFLLRYYLLSPSSRPIIFHPRCHYFFPLDERKPYLYRIYSLDYLL